MAANVSTVLTKLSDDLLPVASTLRDTINKTILIQVGLNPKSPHNMKYYDSTRLEWVTISERDIGSVESWSKMVLQKLLEVAQADRRKLPDWLAGLSSIIGLDTENHLNVDPAKCPSCDNQNSHCTKTKVECIHFCIGDHYITILTPAQKPTRVDPRLGKFKAPDKATEGMHTCLLYTSPSPRD